MLLIFNSRYTHAFFSLITLPLYHKRLAYIVCAAYIYTLKFLFFFLTIDTHKTSGLIIFVLIRVPF